MKKFLAFLLFSLIFTGCYSPLVIVHERHVPVYDIGKAIDSAIRKVENTGNFISDIKIEKNSSHKIAKNKNNERKVVFMETYDIIVSGDVWEKRLVYYYYRTAENYEDVKKELNRRLKESNVWVSD